MTASAAALLPAKPQRRRGNRALRRFLRHRSAVVAGLVVLAFVFIALLAPFLAPYDPIKTNFLAIRKPPSAVYWLGTDEAGRDVLSRVLHGGRESMAAAAAVIVAALLIGLVVGATAGWCRGAVDEALMRLTDLFFAFPPLCPLKVRVGENSPSL